MIVGSAGGETGGRGLIRICSARPRHEYSEPALAPTRITIGDLAVVTLPR